MMEPINQYPQNLRSKNFFFGSDKPNWVTTKLWGEAKRENKFSTIKLENVEKRLERHLDGFRSNLPREYFAEFSCCIEKHFGTLPPFLPFFHSFFYFIYFLIHLREGKHTSFASATIGFELAAILFAIFSVVSINLSAGTTRLTKPAFSASSAVHLRHLFRSPPPSIKVNIMCYCLKRFTGAGEHYLGWGSLSRRKKTTQSLPRKGKGKGRKGKGGWSVTPDLM